MGGHRRRAVSPGRQCAPPRRRPGRRADHVRARDLSGSRWTDPRRRRRAADPRRRSRGALPLGRDVRRQQHQDDPREPRRRGVDRHDCRPPPARRRRAGQSVRGAPDRRRHQHQRAVREPLRPDVDRHLRARADARRPEWAGDPRAPAVLPHDNVLAVFEDGEENVWVGTHGGLLRLRRSAASTITTADGAPSSINTIYEDRDGSLLVAGLNGRLFEVERQTLVPVKLPPGLETLPIRNVFRDRKGRLWIGTDGRGVARVDGTSIVRYTMKDGLGNDFVRAFCEDADGGVWIGTDGGVSHWRDGVFQTFKRSTGLVYSSIRMLLIDRTGTLWVATDGGVSWIRSGKLVADPTLDRLRGLRVWALHEDAGGGMWIGTQGAGLFLLQRRRPHAVHDRARPAEQQDPLHRRGSRRVSLAERPERRRVGLPGRPRDDAREPRSTPGRPRLRHTRRAEHQSDDRRRPERRGHHVRGGRLAAEHDGRGARRAGAARTPRPPLTGDWAADRRWPAGCGLAGDQCASGRWQAGDPLHGDSTRHARTPALQILDGRVRARLDARRPAAGGLLHQPSAGHLSVPRRRVRDERAAERDGQSDGDQAASALLPHQVVPRAVRVDGRHRRVGRVPAARAEHPPAVRRGARRTQSAGA